MLSFGMLTLVSTKPHPDEPSPVTIVYPTAPLNVSVERSKSVTLECVLSGNPSSAVKWTRDGREVSVGSRRRSLLHRNLVLSDVTPADSGAYRCSVESDSGTVFSANYTVNVLGEFGMERSEEESNGGHEFVK